MACMFRAGGSDIMESKETLTAIQDEPRICTSCHTCAFQHIPHWAAAQPTGPISDRAIVLSALPSHSAWGVRTLLQSIPPRDLPRFTLRAVRFVRIGFLNPWRRPCVVARKPDAVVKGGFRCERFLYYDRYTGVYVC
jgi:hypothetical protein